MSIEKLTSGDNFVEDFKNKINELVEWTHRMEKLKMTPSNAGHAKIPDLLDLNGFVTVEKARQAGLNV